MKKAIFAAGAVAAMIGTLGSGSAFAASGNTAVISGGSAFDVCIATNGSYTGSSFAADIVGSGFETQLVYDDFTNEACKNVTLPAGNNTISMRKTSGMDVTSWAIAGNKLTFTASEISSSFLRSSSLIRKSTPASVVEVSFNANGGTGSMASASGVPNVTITLPNNTLTREDYLFNGWNTKADGTGVFYADGATISSDHGGVVELFAQWKEDFATLMTGYNFNSALKDMVNDYEMDGYTRVDKGIKKIEFVEEMPEEVTSVSQISVAIDGSLPITAYYDGNGNIYIDSSAKKIYTNEDSSMMFSNMMNLNTVTFLGPDSFSTSRTTSMYFMFANSDKSYRNIPVSDYSSLSTINGIEYFNTSRVMDMRGMFGNTIFNGANSLATVQRDGYKSWDMSNVEKIDSMFYRAVNLTDISSLSSWDIKKVRYAGNLFSGCESLTDISPIRDWSLERVIEMHGMFKDASSLSDISPLTYWRLPPSLTSLNGLFYNTKISNLDALRTTQRDGYKSWDVSYIKDLSGMFAFNDYLTNITALESWNVSNVELYGNTTYSSGSGRAAVAGMFERCRNLTNITALSDWDVSKAKNMSRMFGTASHNGRMSLSDLSPLSKWNTSSVTIITGMFSDTAVTNLEPLRTTQRDGYKSWDVLNVEDIANVFSGVDGLTDISPLSSWNVGNVKEMSNAFDKTSIRNLNAVSGWNVANVTSMGGMFSDITTLTDVSGVSTWDVRNVKRYYAMFRNDSNIGDLRVLNSWNVDTTADIMSMFDGIPSSVLRPDWYQE